jgi:ketosteroid isomerase-like protein
MAMAMAMTAALTGLGVSAQTGGSMMTDHSAVEKALIANENAVNDAFAKKDVAKMKSFIADDAVAVDMGGVTAVGDMMKMIPTMDMKLTEQALSNYKFVWVDANTAVLSYTWTAKGMAMGQPVQSPVYASTVWAKRGTKWVAVFHQESVAAPAQMKK